MQESDVLLIGGGVMSAHLGVLLKLIDPTLRIQVLEAAGGFAQESSNGWHNAGTGHAGLCELSYTPEQSADGTVDVTNAINIFQKFEDSLQFWAYAVEMGIVGPPAEFINPVPHLSFVTGRKDIGYLRSRHTAMARHHFFEGIEFSEDRAEVSRWAPLLLEGRGHERVAATRMSSGTDVDFGGVSRQLFSWLGRQPDCGLACNHTVVGLKQTTNGWEIRARDSILSAFRLGQSSSLWAQEAAACDYCSKPAYLKRRAWEAFPSAASGLFATIRRWSSGTRPKFTDNPCQRRRLWRCLISIPACLMVRKPCSSAHSLNGRLDSFIGAAIGAICPNLSGFTISPLCLESDGAIWIS